MAANSTAISGLRPWQPGQSGNPKGRPSTSALRAALRPHETEVIDTLIALLKSDADSVRLGAVREFFDRLYGKPESITAEDLSESELLAAVLKLKAAEQERPQ